MSNISDVIEKYIKREIQLSEKGTIEVQRSTLAEKFQCVPSQINYVISTRFPFEKGFLVESKRGGGGYIRIKKLEFGSKRSLYESLVKGIDNNISYSTAVDMLERIKEESIISDHEYNLIKASITREVLLLPLPLRDQIRSNILKGMLKIIFSK